jgi:hypothetical protein
MAVTKNVLREKVARINAKLEDHTRLRISLEHDANGYAIVLNGGNYLASQLPASDAEMFLEGMRSMFFILKGGK